MTGPLLLGTHFYQGGPEEMRRQGLVMDALGRRDDVIVVDLQWQPQAPKRAWIQPLVALGPSSTRVTGHEGRVKPIVSDMFDALAAAAERAGSRYFVFFNADCLLTDPALDLIRRERRDVYAFSRMNHDADGRDLGMYVKGLDAFAVSAAWWRAHRHRFRPYIVGERSWDNVFGAIAMCHGDTMLVNRDPLLRHEAHAIVWGTGPFDAYNRYLTALDFRYFRLWVTYHQRLVDARARGASVDEEDGIARDVFVWRRSAAAAAMQAARSVKAHVRYRTQLSRGTSDAQGAGHRI